NGASPSRPRSPRSREAGSVADAFTSGTAPTLSCPAGGSVTTLHIHDIHRIALARVDLLAGVRSPDVANARGDRAELCGPELRPVWSSPPVVGVALTVQLAAGDNLGAIAASFHAQPGDVLVLAGGEAVCAQVGGRIARVAMSRGVRACVVDGAV